MEYRLLNADGEYRWLLDMGTPNYDSSGAFIGYIGHCFDITDRKTAEDELNKREDRHRTILQTAKAGFWAVNGQGRLLEVNDAYCLMSGYSEEELLRMHVSDMEASEDKAITAEHMQKVSDRGQDHFETQHRRKDGSVFDAEVSVMFRRFNGGQFIAFIQDITERKKSQRNLLEINKQLIDSKQKAELSDQLKSAFLANMSHEIRTPMNGILGFTELLKESDITLEEKNKFLNVIEKSGNRLLNIINDIIYISKIESGQMEVVLSRTNINEQLDDLFSFFAKEAEHNGLSIRIGEYLPSDDSLLITDREKVYSVLVNLIKNALKFTVKGSVEFGCHKEDGFLTFFVKDTGIGIHQDQLGVVFERFRQAAGPKARNYEGTGLGLSISKAYVEMLGGKIWVESQAGLGSTFYFTIPCHA
jgi:PAS domain S-box-containing protein